MCMWSSMLRGHFFVDVFIFISCHMLCICLQRKILQLSQLDNNSQTWLERDAEVSIDWPAVPAGLQVLKDTGKTFVLFLNLQSIACRLNSLHW